MFWEQTSRSVLEILYFLDVHVHDDEISITRRTDGHRLAPD
jgi:hypothetical protein